MRSNHRAKFKTNTFTPESSVFTAAPEFSGTADSTLSLRLRGGRGGSGLFILAAAGVDTIEFGSETGVGGAFSLLDFSFRLGLGVVGFDLGFGDAARFS